MADGGLYDVILVDAYQDITIPFQMSSAEFFTLVRGHLKDGGVMVVNMNMHSDGEGSINEYLTDTICSVFGSVYTADVPYTTNRELFACTSGDIFERLAASAEEPEDAALRQLMRRVSRALVPCAGGSRILTDDRAPVELLGMKMIDGLIADEVSYYKTIYENEGLGGVLADFGIG